MIIRLFSGCLKNMKLFQLNQRPFSEFKHESQSLITLALPIMLAQIATVGVGAVDTAMAGAAGKDDLTAVALGSAVFNTLFITFLGMMASLNPIISQLHGAGKTEEVGETGRQGLWFGLSMGMIGMIFILLMIQPAQAYLTMSERIENMLGDYLFYAALGLPAAMLHRALHAYASSLNRPKPIMWVSWAALLLNIPLNYIFVYGKFGLPEMGGAGCGLATALVFWFNALALGGYIVKNRYFQPFGLTRKMSFQNWHIQRQMWGLGLPIGFSYFLEAAIRWRYPTRGLKSGFLALILFTSLSVWVQGVYRDGTASNIWANDANDTTSDSTDSPMAASDAAAASHVSTNHTSAASTASKPNELNANSLIKVERDFDLFNPWAQKGTTISCESLSKQHYPVLLPPRFLEDGYEWRNYQHGDGVCNNLLYVGTPYQGKPADIFYKIWQDRRSNIYLMMSNQADQALFNESFTMTRDNNGLAKSDYAKQLKTGFSHLIDDDSAPEADQEYIFTKAETPTAPDTLPAGCTWQSVKARPNTYQWGTGRINFRGQSIVKPYTFCSDKHAGVVHLSMDIQAAAKGKTNTMEQRLHIKLFNAHTLKPLQCGSVSIPLSASETLAWQSGQLKAENIYLDPLKAEGCLNVSVKLSNGRTVSSGK